MQVAYEQGRLFGKVWVLRENLDSVASELGSRIFKRCFCFCRVKDYANRVKSGVPTRNTNLKPKSKYIPRRVSVIILSQYSVCSKLSIGLDLLWFFICALQVSLSLEKIRGKG